MQVITFGSLLFMLLLFPCIIQAGPVLPEQPHTRSFSRFLRDTGLIRLQRQDQAVVCQNNTDCLPEGTVSAPSDLVRCIAGECICNSCFMHNDSTSKCRLCPSFPFSEDDQECALDRRRSQLTAFLLSFFLSSTGAANFYIGRNDLGGGQLFLLLFLLTLSYSLCCIPCCLACCAAKEEMKGSIIFMTLMIIVVILVLLASLALMGWWIADIVIFATNQRLSSDGCVLQPNL